MGFWDDVRRAAEEARQQARAGGPVRVDVREDASRRAEPPTITVDAQGHAQLEKVPGPLTLLGRSLKLLILAVAALGLSWLTAVLVALYLLWQRLTASPPAAETAPAR
ncbi:MAG: hypothetical protein AB2A00_42405 [Myxococcota bacterium]